MSPGKMMSNGQFLDCGRSVAITDAALSLCKLGGRSAFAYQGTPSVGNQSFNRNKTVIRGASESPACEKEYIKKPRCPRIGDAAIPFEEMKRLMRVYGPITCLRNRTSKESRNAVQQKSIRRKFYRWFPDLHERFEITPDGWYTPKAGHEQEMKYREDLRKEDAERLVVKRLVSRMSNTAQQSESV